MASDPDDAGPAHVRYLGVDVARGLAIVGMLVLHVLPATSLEGLHAVVADGRPQILFAVLDGIALSIVARSAPNRSAARRVIAVRACALLALGLWLGSLGSGVLVILDSYGVYFLLVLPLLYAPRWVLALCAGLMLAFGPWASAAAAGSQEALDYVPLTALAESWLLTGPYPAIVYLGYVLLGILTHRLGLIASRRGIQVGVGCAAAAVVAYSTAWVLEGFASVTAVLTVRWSGSAALVVGLVAALGRLLDVQRVRSGVRWFAWPLSSLGAMPVTAYTLHVVALAALARWGQPQQGEGTFWVVLGGLVVFAALWMRVVPRGPLETVIRQLWTPSGLHDHSNRPAAAAE